MNPVGLVVVAGAAGLVVAAGVGYQIAQHRNNARISDVDPKEFDPNRDAGIREESIPGAHGPDINIPADSRDFDPNRIWPDGEIPQGPACEVPGIGSERYPELEQPPYLETSDPDDFLEDLDDIQDRLRRRDRSLNPSSRRPTRGANRRDRQNVDNIAREYGVNRREFGDYVEQLKAAEGRGGADNYTYDELREIAEEFRNN